MDAPVAADDDGGSAEKVEANAAAAHRKKAARVAEMLGELGDYELLEEVGRGGQGVVFRARQKSLNRTVALKIISLGQWASKAHLKRFRREAEAAASLDHSGIVPIYEVGERDGSCYFSMKFVEGGQLDEVGRRAPISIRQAAELIVKVARTVHYAHQHGILHRDIKPGNVLLDQNGEPHLTDFGLARLVESESTVTRTLEVLGTPSYMAPEQAVGNNTQLTSATDVYGLGAVFYQLLTSQPPFAGGTTYETIRLLLNTEPRQPRQLNSKVDRDVSTICLKCLEKDPKRRYSSALVLAEDLERWLKHEPIRARQTGVFGRGRKWVRRNPASALLAASLIALAAATGWIVWKSELIRQPLTTGIAVLPFENLGDEKEHTAFADGVQDDILTKLAKIADLKVISRTSVMGYRGKRNVRQIGDVLRVSHVLEGSARRSGDRIHLNAQLIDTRTDTHVWAEEYDRNLNDLFAIQSEIAQKVADQLRSRLSPAERAAIAERPTTDLVAYALYTKAMDLDIWGNWDGVDKSMNQRVELLEKATQHDPNFALAYCALAKAETYLFSNPARMWEVGNDRMHLELAKKAAEAALRARPDFGEAHLELARYYFYTGDYDRARDELTIARQKLPNNSEALVIEGRIDRHQNRWDAALANLQKAYDLDPRNVEVAWRLGEIYGAMRRYHEYEQLRTQNAANGILPGPWLQLELANTKLDMGDPVAAQSLLAQVPLDFSPTEEIWNTRFVTALYLRDYDAANRVLAAIPEKWADDTFDGLPLGWAEGLIARARGDKQKAQSAFATAREKLEATLADKPKDAHYFEQISGLDAGLGRKEDAIREALRAVSLMPIAKDSEDGPIWVTNLAVVYAWTGKPDRALEQLEIVATIPKGPSYGDLRFNPCWDSLRGDKRFDKIVAAAKAASR